MRVCIPICPQSLVGQLAALPDANLQHYIGKMLVQVIPQPSSKEGGSSVQMPHEACHAQAAPQRTQPMGQSGCQQVLLWSCGIPSFAVAARELGKYMFQDDVMSSATALQCTCTCHTVWAEHMERMHAHCRGNHNANTSPRLAVMHHLI